MGIIQQETHALITQRKSSLNTICCASEAKRHIGITLPVICPFVCPSVTSVLLLLVPHASCEILFTILRQFDFDCTHKFDVLESEDMTLLGNIN